MLFCSSHYTIIVSAIYFWVLTHQLRITALVGHLLNDKFLMSSSLQITKIQFYVSNYVVFGISNRGCWNQTHWSNWILLLQQVVCYTMIQLWSSLEFRRLFMMITKWLNKTFLLIIVTGLQLKVAKVKKKKKKSFVKTRKPEKLDLGYFKRFKTFPQ